MVMLPSLEESLKKWNGALLQSAVIRWHDYFVFQSLNNSVMTRLLVQVFRRWAHSSGASFFGIVWCALGCLIFTIRSSASVLIELKLNQSWVYSGVALITFQVYSRSGVDCMCSTLWSRTYAVSLIPFHWSRGVSFYSGPLRRLKFPTFDWDRNDTWWQKL